jgi:hypothetical protein
MFNIIIIDRVTKNQKVIESVSSEEKAINFCESWAWMYSDEKGVNYWLDYEEV